MVALATPFVSMACQNQREENYFNGQKGILANKRFLLLMYKPRTCEALMNSFKSTEHQYYLFSYPADMSSCLSCGLNVFLI